MYRIFIKLIEKGDDKMNLIDSKLHGRKLWGK